MAIKSTTFGRVELSGNDAARFVTHMNEDNANPKAKKSLQKGRQILSSVRTSARASAQVS